MTELLDILSVGEGISRDALLLRDFAQVLAIPLRDGCDLMDVVGGACRRRCSRPNEDRRPEEVAHLLHLLELSGQHTFMNPSSMSHQA